MEEHQTVDRYHNYHDDNLYEILNFSVKQQAEEKEERKQAESVISMETEEGNASDSDIIVEEETAEQEMEEVITEKDILDD